MQLHEIIWKDRFIDKIEALIVFFIRKEHVAALPISARNMTDSERDYYERQAEAD